VVKQTSVLVEYDNLFRPIMINRLNKINRLTIGVPFGGASQSWESYWANQTEVLFFGLYSEISGGQMPNKKTGSSDYLTVAGSAGSETYQCPNTAPYIAADTDYIWFKTDETQRTVTTAELIGYDLQRTPVKYQDASPNEIVAIIILNAAVTGTKRDCLFRDMWLPILWDNDLNGYGHVKDNRIGQQLWTPEAVATFIDTFTDDDDTLLSEHTPDTANFTWSQDNDDYKISGNKAVAVYSDDVAIAYFNEDDNNGDMSVTLEIPDGDYFAGLAIRYKTSAQHFRVVIRRASSGTPEIRIYKYATVLTSVEVSHSPGDGVLRCVTSGAYITVYWKGVKVIDRYETDGSYIDEDDDGIISYLGSTYSPVKFDNLQIV